ncbi:MAG: hypothetical protein IKO22_04235 [Oscillospiraceae bacterium]|nr:hypothetical protein [Oscillospiraceae bacterium]
MGKRVFNPKAPFQSLRNTAALTGLSVGFLRDGCKAGTIPHIMAGNEYRINIVQLLAQLEAESKTSTHQAKTWEGAI